MSKNTRKCPKCGAAVSADAKYCRKCNARLDSGRVVVLSKPARRETRRDAGEDDALRNLPRPVRPTENAAPRRRSDGFFTPEQAPAEYEDDRPGRKGRMDDHARDGKRPVSTARGVEEDEAAPRRSGKNLWQMAAVLAVILVVIVVAIVLVVRLNSPADSAQTSQTFGQEGPSPTQLPAVTPGPTEIPAPTETPAPTQEPAPTQAPAPETQAAANIPDGVVVAEANETVYINGLGVNIRTGPGKSYNALGSENTGYELRRTGRADNGWSRVLYEGQEGYVASELLTTEKPAQQVSNKQAYTVAEASGTVTVRTDSNLRTGPGTNYGVHTTVATGTELTRTGVSGDWTRVSYDNKTLFVSTSLLKNYGLDVEEMSGTVTISKNEVRIRYGPGTGYGKLATVNSGLSLTLTGKYGDWYQVTYNGQTGYVRDDLATKN